MEQELIGKTDQSLSISNPKAVRSSVSFRDDLTQCVPFLTSDRTVLVDTNLPFLKGLYVMGTLEFPVDRSNVLSVVCMVIAGGELKVGVYGKVQLHGACPKKSWTRLAADIASGNERIIVEDTVDWRPHDKIVLSSSSYEPHEAEVLTVKEVQAHHVKIHERLKHRHVGVLQFSNVEIQNFGSPLYSAIELTNVSAGSWIISSTLHQSCSGGIRVAASHGIILKDNLVFGTVGHGIDLEGQNFSVSNNLVVLMTQSAWSTVWVAGIKVNQARDISLYGNVVAGSERLGFHIRGHRCSFPEARWSDNVAHSSLHGLHLYKENGLDNCTGISGFLAFKNFDYGAMLHAENSVELEDITLSLNGVSRRKVGRRTAREEGGCREEAAAPAPSITSVTSRGHASAPGSPAQHVYLQETGNWKEAQEQWVRYQLAGQDQRLLFCPDLRQERQQMQGQSQLGQERGHRFPSNSMAACCRHLDPISSQVPFPGRLLALCGKASSCQDLKSQWICSHHWNHKTDPSPEMSGSPATRPSPQAYSLRHEILQTSRSSCTQSTAEAGPRLASLAIVPWATEVRINPVELNPDILAHMIPKVEWVALPEAADTLNLVKVPKGPTEGYEHDEKLLRQMHHMLLQVDVLEGTLQCPESGLLPNEHLTMQESIRTPYGESEGKENFLAATSSSEKEYEELDMTPECFQKDEAGLSSDTDTRPTSFCSYQYTASLKSRPHGFPQNGCQVCQPRHFLGWEEQDSEENEECTETYVASPAFFRLVVLNRHDIITRQLYKSSKHYGLVVK
ncbi:hypothetical protein GH733_000440 [Mirounga leonina]|nr:hypothetical protein GH733_000440 [Mirounga leonina]